MSAQYIKDAIEGNDVVVFSKSYCPYCTSTKRAMAGLGLSSSPLFIELDEVSDGTSIQDALASLTGQRTVPNVFVKGQHLGGNDDTQAAISGGQFKAMLA